MQRMGNFLNNCSKIKYFILQRHCSIEHLNAFKIAYRELEIIHKYLNLYLLYFISSPSKHEHSIQM